MKKTELTLTSKHNNRPFLVDANYIENDQAKPVIIFNHGFKGFKDWGPFNLTAEKFARAGFVFIKMNFSHNGTTPDNPRDFADLEAFAQNNFSIELDDTGVLIDYLFSSDCSIPVSEINLDHLYIMGHSRGGASAILKAAEDPRIKKIVTWAAVNNLESWHSEEEIEYWKKKGRIYIQNARTNQEMPMDYQLVENFIENSKRLQVPGSIRKMTIPMLALHGSTDPTVRVEAVKEMKSWNPNIEIDIIENADHTFGGGHPFEGSELPEDLARAVGLTIEFFSRL